MGGWVVIAHTIPKEVAMPRLSCPLCESEADVTPLHPRVADRVDCDTCGEFEIDNLIASVGVVRYQYVPDSPDIRVGNLVYVLSGLTRRASIAGDTLSIREDNVSQLLQSVMIPASPLENMDKALLYISERQRKADDEFQVFFDKDYPLAFAKDGSEFRFFLDTLVERDLLHRRGDQSLSRNNQFYRLTPEGWEKVERIKKVQTDSSQAFIAMWFDNSLEQAWHEGFQPALTELDYQPIRIDLVPHNDKICDRIEAEIRRSGLLVADMTGNRGGVYFEAGFAKGLNIPVVWTCRRDYIDELPFDVRQYNCIVCDQPRDLQENLIYRIEATIPGKVRAA